MRVTLGAPGRIMPPAAKAIELAQRAEADGFDAIWWPCHLMGWIPDSAWTEDMTELAKYQDNPHVHFDPLMMMGAAGAATSSIKVGVCVTDTIRRHPAMLAQAALTADHLSQGRAILGLGSGERMNVTPYGLDFSKPVGRLEEAIEVMRLLWSTDKPVSYDGTFHQLHDAVLGLEPYEGVPPQVWLAAHGPRMLKITGRLADGWLPTNIKPEAYAEKLAAIRESAEANDRDPDAITPSMLAYVMCAPDEETLERLCAAPMSRLLFAAVDLPAETYARHGSTSPFEGGTGFHSFLPTTVSRAEVERIVEHIPAGIVREHTLCGTPEQLAEQIRAYQQAGLRDVILWNITPFADPALSGYSFKAMTELRRLLDADAVLEGSATDG
ncbi:MAG TPA: LLM class flavin-dependent oxidoreductase [Baekduia sp.]|uniref:LLM class flavin-dependent oxidoreductase n=1 Tax=Baekduia sp. TaxID=2600305 RepID=UPI002D79E00D|nr:LLM class flavin-dependent oxidoreductase [Baekduia sp.]HET6507032.1 LLM class flavin-dependent oxidoreductase [Baekduia sp.]